MSEHARLVSSGAAWLRRQGFAVVATELSTAATQEIPDVIGFRSLCSVVIEAKVSRADFLRDKKKWHRQRGGLGIYRFYLCPPGIISASELPERWGLLHDNGATVARVVCPRGNMWPPFGSDMAEWAEFQHEPNYKIEARVLYSIARRLSEKKHVAA